MEFGMDVERAYKYLSNENPGAVFNVIKAATGHLNQKPSNDDIEAFIAEQSTADKGLDKFCKELINEMTRSEERRVGKECRSRRLPEQYNKKGQLLSGGGEFSQQVTADSDIQ